MEFEPPAGTTFFGLVGQQPAELADPDGDGTYAGSLTLPEGFYAPGPFPIPVWITTGTPEIPNQQVVEDFGKVVLEDGDAFSAGVSFCDDGTDGGNGNGGSGGTDNGSGGAVVSADTSNADKGDGNSVVSAPAVDVDGNGSMDASDGEEAARISDSAETSAASVLPATGGILPIAGAVGALLLGGGLVARRIFS